MISAQEIAEAKKRTKYRHPSEIHHEHDDCIRIAYEWLDAQKRIKASNRRFRAIKHIIENWAGRYVSQSDVEVAAELHPDIFGIYPHFNISSRLVRPSNARLVTIPQAGAHPNYQERLADGTYAQSE